ncbi:MAG TPA: TolC family outer membrane protein [Chromatiaceae bacterium]|nr:TolC family outer membrane protein [Chromatiaceae bacterium]
MTRTSHAALLAGLLLALPPLALGEDLLQIYDLAVESDPTLREAGAQLNADREAKPQAKALLLPNIGLQGEVTYNNVRTRGNNVAGSFSRSDSFTDGALNPAIRQTVYNRAQWIGLKQTDNTIAAAEAQYRSAEIDLMANTTVAYFEILRRADAVRVSESLVRANERTLDQSKQRFEVGLVAITDVNESQAAFDLSRANLILAQNALDTSWEALRQIVGPIKVPLYRLGDKLPLAPPEPNSIDKWAEAALAGNYGIVAAAEAAEAAKKGIEIQRSGHYPTLDAQAGYNWTRSSAEFNTDLDGAYIGLQVSVPIYQGGAVDSRTRQAGFSFQAAQDRLDQQRRAVTKEVKDAFNGIISSISDVQARQAAVVSARSNLESTQAGLEVGTRTQVDVLNAQRGLFQAEFDYLSSRYNYVINGVRLHQATSTLTRDVLAKGNAWLTPVDPVPPPAH